jgi:hypothetical protein
MGISNQRPWMVKNREGDKRKNKFGSNMTIVEYISSNEIIIEFEDGYRTQNNYGNFKKGLIKNPYNKTIYGVGFIGIENYSNLKNLSYEKSYQVWRDMMYRCYNLKSKAYSDKYVNEEWHNYSMFKTWFDNNYYTIENETIHLDKDVLYERNKEYSSKNCIFVPQTISQVFQRNDRKGKKLPIGVIPYGEHLYQAVMCDNIIKERISSKVFDVVEDAHAEYIQMKRDYILRLAEHYKNIIPQKLYDKLIIYSKEFIKYEY